MQLSNPTIGNIFVAVATFLMPCAVPANVLLCFRQTQSQRLTADIAARLTALQLPLVLAW